MSQNLDQNRTPVFCLGQLIKTLLYLYMSDLPENKMYAQCGETSSTINIIPKATNLRANLIFIFWIPDLHGKII